jgi:hypothetical protein
VSPIATHTQRDDTLILKLGTVDYAAQVIDASFDPPGYGAPTLTPVASDLSKVSEPGEPENGTLSGTVFKDNTTAGFTRALAAARIAGTKLVYIYTDNSSTDQISYTGDCYVQAVPQDFTPDKLGRHSFTLTIVTATLT